MGPRLVPPPKPGPAGVISSPSSFDLTDLAMKSRRLNSGPRRVALAGGIALWAVGGGLGVIAWFTGGRDATPVLLGVFGFFGGIFLIGGLFGPGLRVPTSVERVTIDRSGAGFQLDSGSMYRVAWDDPAFAVDVDDLANAPLEGASMRAGLRFWIRLGREPRVAQSGLSLAAFQALVAAALERGLSVDDRIEKVGGRREGTGEPVRRVTIHRGARIPGSSAVRDAEAPTLAPLPTKLL